MNHAPARMLAALLLSGCATVATLAPSVSDARALTFQDLMRFEQIARPVIAEDGSWIAYELAPDRGDGAAVFRATLGELEHRVELGGGPRVTSDGRWGVARLDVSFEQAELAKDEKDESKEPRPGLAVVELASGETESIERVKSFALSDDGRWLAYLRHEEPKQDDGESAEAETGAETAPAEEVEGEVEDEDEQDEPKEPDPGTTLHLRELAGGAEVVREHVASFAFDETSSALVFAVSAPEGAGNGLYALELGAQAGEERALHAADLAVYSHLTWCRERALLAFVAAEFDTEDGEPRDASLWTWDGAGDARRVAGTAEAPAGFELPAANELRFSRDGERLFFGFKPVDPDAEEQAEEVDGEGPPPDPYDVEAILEDTGVDVWHWNDPWINSNQKQRWEESEKDRVYLAVAHLASARIVPLADLDMPRLVPSDNATSALGFADVPYRKELTWDGAYADLYLVELGSGARTRIRERHSGGARLSPSGRFVSYYADGDWHLFDRTSGTTTNVTAHLGVPFANEDHDYPSDPPGYGQGEWLADDSAFLVYDKYDVWQVHTDGREPLRLTAGRGDTLIHRVVDRDPKEDTLEPGAPLLLRAYHDLEKHDAFVLARLGEAGTRAAYATGEHRLRFVAQAEDSPNALFTRERYDEYPDLWVTDFEDEPRRLTDAGAQTEGFAWGAAELVEWRSADGVPLQGVLIKPDNHVEGQRYPVLVYFYRFFSQRLHEFNEPVVNHRPSFPLYASNGYAVFLPDVRFEVGSPGFSATKCLVPGIQKLIDMGVADPDAIGLHGHSWSGYQAAFVITQTDAFAAAAAGAPVSNMTSAYGGLRYGTGLSRQFQYEKSQSRIGGSLWEYPERYIENSPVFFADRIDTPLLIEFGDEDEAVPWTQGVELYMACRRLGKECVFLQYRGEPHHLKQYANKLDYSIKMKQFFDHHLKGAEAPAWMVEGVPYRGE